MLFVQRLGPLSHHRLYGPAEMSTSEDVNEKQACVNSFPRNVKFFLRKVLLTQHRLGNSMTARLESAFCCFSRAGYAKANKDSKYLFPNY